MEFRINGACFGEYSLRGFRMSDKAQLAPATAPVPPAAYHGNEINLPPPGTKRWVMRRKAEVVNGVRTGVITIEEACNRYNISAEEFASWQRLIEHHGIRGLRTTRVQQYRLRP